MPSIHSLLRDASLPTEGVDETLIEATVVAVTARSAAGAPPDDPLLGAIGRNAEIVAGSASVEVHGEVGLLRSVVVAKELRRHGWGIRLVEDRIAWARGRGLETIVLLTETAAEFFERLGFEHVAREELPVEVHGSFEFGFCPDASRSMRLDLGGDGG